MYIQGHWSVIVNAHIRAGEGRTAMLERRSKGFISTLYATVSQKTILSLFISFSCAKGGNNFKAPNSLRMKSLPLIYVNVSSWVTETCILWWQQLIALSRLPSPLPVSSHLISSHPFPTLSSQDPTIIISMPFNHNLNNFAPTKKCKALVNYI